MKQKFTLTAGIIAFLLGGSAMAQSPFSFTNANSRLATPAFHSGVAVTVADVDGDGLDDVIRLSQGHDLYIEYQKTGNQFVTVHIGDFGNASAWGMSVADVDHNGYKDVLAGPINGAVLLAKIGPSGLMGSMVSLPSSNFFLQNATFIDVNNDGWEDIFCCDDDGPSHIWTNDGSGNFTVSSIINFDVTPGQTTGQSNDDSGNYGSVWTDFDNDGDMDLYIAKCRQAYQNPSDPRRWDVMFVNNGSNVYTESANSFGLRDSGQTWTASFGDIDNDGDFDVALTDYDVPAKIHINDGTGHFSNLPNNGFALSMGQPIQAVMEDFDNDGFVDILVTGSYSEMYHNNGNSTFTEIPGLFDGNNMESFAIGDLNHDGKEDIYASYASIYTNPTGINDVIWLNNAANNNNFITFDLKGTVSNKTALGARVTLYGPWGKQIREVRAGESYGACNSSELHFGLGSNTHVDSAVVHWPSGMITHIPNPTINQFVVVTEGQCISPDNVVTAVGPMVLCANDSVTLHAATGSGYTYLWSTGSTASSIVVHNAGEYDVRVTAPGNACSSISAIVNVLNTPDQTPTVSAGSDTTFCQGGAVTLSSSSAASYQWNLNGNPLNGETGQTTNANQTGTYTVTIAGACQNWTSLPVSVHVLATPVTPTANGTSINTPQSVTLTATGTNDQWYDAATAGNLLYSGSSFSTPVLNTTTTYYVDDHNSYGGSTHHTAQQYHYGSNYSGSMTVNYYDNITVTGNCVLQSAKVYTDSFGVRIIELQDNAGNVLQSQTVNVTTDSAVITLNFNLTPGTYRLATNTAQNQTSFGFAAPRFERSNINVTYPYTVNGLLSITGSSGGSNVYYYFYDMVVVVPPTLCTSSRTPVTVTYDGNTGISQLLSENSFNLYPNPASGQVQVELNLQSSEATVAITDLSGRILRVRSLNNLSKGQTISMDLSGLAAGSYLVQVQANDQLFKKSLVVVR